MRGLLNSLEAAVNLMEMKQKKAVFGENSYSQINSLHYSGQKKAFIADVTLYTDEPELLEDSYNTVYEDYIHRAWRLLGISEKLIVVKKCELL